MSVASTDNVNEAGATKVNLFTGVVKLTKGALLPLIETVRVAEASPAEFLP